MATKPHTLNDSPASTATWQQTKSQQTRDAILQATVECFYELGYANTSTENIAKKAALSRGAMLHHFPTRFDLITAAVKYLNDKRLAMYAEGEQAAQAGAEYTRIEDGIDSYWAQLKSPTFVVFHELRVAARTDPELSAVLEPANAEFTAALLEQTRALFPDLALSEAFIRANHLTHFLLEGMAVTRATSANSSDAVPEDILLPWLKRELRRSFQDVHGTVKRKPAPEN